MTEEQIAALLRDVMYAYSRIREDSEGFVESRYPKLSGKQKQEKEREVESQAILADMIYENSNVIAKDIFKRLS